MVTEEFSNELRRCCIIGHTGKWDNSFNRSYKISKVYLGTIQKYFNNLGINYFGYDYTIDVQGLF